VVRRKPGPARMQIPRSSAPNQDARNTNEEWCPAHRRSLKNAHGVFIVDDEPVMTICTQVYLKETALYLVMNLFGASRQIADHSRRIT